MFIPWKVVKNNVSEYEKPLDRSFLTDACVSGGAECFWENFAYVLSGFQVTETKVNKTERVKLHQSSITMQSFVLNTAR